MTIDPFDPVPDTASPPASQPASGPDTARTGAAPEAYVGPFEREPWPAQLTAHVVEPGPDARIHGYHVVGDLARHHGMIDVLWLALRGELPTEAERAALDAAGVLLAPVHVGQAPTHAALLARIAGATPEATLAIAAVGLGELVRHERATLAPWTTWLEDGVGPVPAIACATAPSGEAVAGQRWLDGRMRLWFGAGRGLPSVALTRVACGYAVLHRLGLRGPLAIETVALWARLPAVAAEAAHAEPGGVRGYPARLPDYQYVDGQGGGVVTAATAAPPVGAPRPIQRVGHIGDVDNRFCGRAVFADLAATIRNPTELLLLAFGVTRATAADLEIMRCLALCMSTPDARVWPLKLTRTLASYGNPYAGFFGAQLATDSAKMGPGTTANAAASLQWLAAEVGPDPDDAAVAAAVERHKVERGRIAGFGVPFRAEDERLLALRPMLAAHPASRGPMWRLAAQVERVIRARTQLAPNIVIAMAALLLDLGLAARRAGLFVSMLMAHTFAGHALEAADEDGPRLQALPDAALAYQGAGPRQSPAEAARVAVRPTGAGLAAARRCLAW